MDTERNKRDGSPGNALAAAISIALGMTIFVPSSVTAGGLSPLSPHDNVIVAEQQHSLQGPLLVGPVESVSSDGNGISIFGRTLQVGATKLDLLPSQYVAVFGTLARDGSIDVDVIEPLNEVYAPGSSLVFYSGVVSKQELNSGLATIGDMALDGLTLPGFEEWIASPEEELAFVVGTQSIAGAPIRADLVVSFKGNGYLEIDGTGLQGIDGSGLRGIDGSGLRGIDGSGLRGIDGSGLRGIDGSGLRGIDGSGLRGIDGSGLRGIDGSGLRGIDGSGLNDIDGSGAPQI